MADSRPVAISAAQVADIPSIQNIVNAACSKYVDRIGKPPAPMLADYSSLLATHDIFVLRPGSLDDSPVLGSMVLRPDTATSTCQLNNLVVDPAAQGRGYGKILLAYAETWARSKGCSVMKMVENFGLYVKMGYSEIERKVDAGYERAFFRKVLE